MVRVALVEGMKPNYPEPERQRYRRLVKQYLGIREERIDKLFNLLEVEKPSQAQKSFLNDIIAQAAYDSKYWSSLDYEHLKKEDVIIEYNGNIRGIARLLQGIDESKVIFVPSIGERAVTPEDEPDYFKHVDWRNKLVLNGQDVVRRFAQDRGIVLSGKYARSGQIPVEDFHLLEQNGFYFNEALKTAIDGVLKEPEYKDRVISAMAIKRRDGTELRLHPHDFAEAAEFYAYCLRYNPKIVETLGNKLTQLGDKYHGANTFNVPKRMPVGSKLYNEVEIHYIPDPQGGGPYPLDWMSTKAACDCPHALNMRNFEVRKGEMTRVVETMDTHVNMVFLAMIHKKKIPLKQAVNNMSPVPTPEFSNFVDKARYNIVQEFQVEQENGTKTKRTYVGEVGIEKLVHELAKSPEWGFGRMFSSGGKVIKILKPMYI